MISKRKVQVCFGWILLRSLYTCHVPACPRFLALAAEAVEEDQDHEGGVVGDDGPGAAELSLVLHVEPSAEQHNSRHAVQGGLHQQEHQVQGCEGVLLCPVPVSTKKDLKDLKDIFKEELFASFLT